LTLFWKKKLLKLLYEAQERQNKNSGRDARY